LRSQGKVPVLAVATPVSTEQSVLASGGPDENTGLSIAQIVSIVWAYRVHAIVIATVILIFTAAFTKLLPKTYTATATLMVSYEVSDPLGGGQTPQVPVFNYMSTEMQLMTSAEVLLPVIDRLKLTENKNYSIGYRGQGSLDDWIKEELVKELDIEAGRGGSQLIYVTAAARDPNLAAQIANTLVEIYLDQERSRLSGPASERAKRYAQELTELKGKVNIAQDQVTAFRQRNGVTDAAARNNSGEADLLASLETRLQEAQNIRRAAEVRAAGDQTVGSGQAASVTIQSIKTQINTEQVQLAQLRATLGTAHPKVIELQSQIRANQRILNSEFNNFSAGSASDLTSARQLEAKLQAAVQEQRAKVLAVSRLQDEGTKYVLELESAQSVYKRALDGYDQIMFASGAHAANITSVSRAVPPQVASKPNKVKLVFLGLLAGIAAGLLGPMAYELLINRRIRCRDDFERGFAIPVLMEFDSIPAVRSAA
jgi:polysaccharide biosynthesis transport protein